MVIHGFAILIDRFADFRNGQPALQMQRRPLFPTSCSLVQMNGTGDDLIIGAVRGLQPQDVALYLSLSHERHE